jgi:S-adenosylmethionine:tRNA-ribosyltransferase-isomerase (queuine synthetase)
MNKKTTYKILLGTTIFHAITAAVVNTTITIHYDETVLYLLALLITSVGGAIITLVLALDTYRDIQLDEAVLNRERVIFQHKGK